MCVYVAWPCCDADTTRSGENFNFIGSKVTSYVFYSFLLGTSIRGSLSAKEPELD